MADPRRIAARWAQARLSEASPERREVVGRLHQAAPVHDLFEDLKSIRELSDNIEDLLRVTE